MNRDLRDGSISGAIATRNRLIEQIRWSQPSPSGAAALFSAI
jgi:hypothetical protein